MPPLFGLIRPSGLAAKEGFDIAYRLADAMAVLDQAEA